jgi:hypothetical protein
MSQQLYLPRSDISARPGAAVALRAIYLAISWTWCIGMFLPVILVRDYGITGWIVFALPNVIGAAAFGWLVRDREHVDELVAAHGSAMTAFSLVTIAFQVFFVTWFFGRLDILAALVACLILAGTLRIVGQSRPRVDLYAAAVGLAISLAILGWWTFHLLDGSTGNEFSASVFIRPAVDVIGLAPVCLFGFALCPYFDLTFYLTRRDLSAGDARRAFGWGFGLFFLLMIVLSLLYALAVAGLIAGRATSTFMLRLLEVHMVIQIALTVTFHARAAIGQLSDKRGPTYIGASVAVGIFMGVAALAVGRVGSHDAGEMIYRVFLSFYGLVFPAYAWICLLPSLEKPVAPTASRLRTTAAAIALASPMYALGFLLGHPLWLIPGVGIVILSRLAFWQKGATGPIMPAARD